MMIGSVKLILEEMSILYLHKMISRNVAQALIIAWSTETTLEMICINRLIKSFGTCHIFIDTGCNNITFHATVSSDRG